jgi:5-methylthioadenosine/S-adenosylhomocysteine deaminase
MRLRVVVLIAAVFLAVALVVVRSQTPQRQVALVVTNGTVITMNAGRVIPDGAIAIDGSDIVAVDTADAIRRAYRGTDTVDANGQVILPGLINTHTHAPMVLFRGPRRRSGAAGLAHEVHLPG